MQTNEEKKHVVYQVMNAIFCLLVIISNMISAKLMIIPFIGLAIPAGLVTYPFTFVISDIVTEIFGQQKAKLMVYIAFGISLLSLGLTEMSLLLPSDDMEIQHAFELIFGLNAVRVFASLIAYSVSQIADIKIYAFIKRVTNGRFLWLRNNAATCISQLIDTILIDILFLYLGLGMEWKQIFGIMLFAYGYKVAFSVLSTPLFYAGVYAVSALTHSPQDKTINQPAYH